ncbi:MAG: hypothetical protein ACFN40_02330 [Bacteroidota bacterium]
MSNCRQPVYSFDPYILLSPLVLTCSGGSTGTVFGGDNTLPASVCYVSVRMALPDIIHRYNICVIIK